MSKYDTIKFLKETKARVPRHCDKCNRDISKGTIYYKESVGKINTIGMMLRGFCAMCYAEIGDNLLKV